MKRYCVRDKKRYKPDALPCNNCKFIGNCAVNQTKMLRKRDIVKSKDPLTFEDFINKMR